MLIGQECYLAFDLVPVALLDEFARARPRDIAAMELGPRGAALHWEKLDLDFSVAGLLTTVLGTAVVDGRGWPKRWPRAFTCQGCGCAGQWREGRQTSEGGNRVTLEISSVH
ncbi:MAG TPA: DUF2442 domain-containing protein [Blastocatellia bacterium]|jgi:hypothetical protein|nr:DUF2442 domain-containing protein [Blastocatellia bacterium]